MLLLLLLFGHALTCQGDEEEAPLRRWQKLQLPVVHAVLQQEPKCFSNGCYIQTLDSYNMFDIAGMNNPSLLGFHILDMLMILLLLLLLLFLLFLLLQYLLLLLLVPLPVAAAATQSPLPFHLLLPTALQQMVHGGVDGCQQKEPHVCWGGCVVVVASSVQHSCPVLLLLLPPSHLLLLLPGPSFDLTPGGCCSCCCSCCCCFGGGGGGDGGGLQFSFPHYRYCYSLPRRPPRRLQNWVELKKDLKRRRRRRRPFVGPLSSSWIRSLELHATMLYAAAAAAAGLHEQQQHGLLLLLLLLLRYERLHNPPHLGCSEWFGRHRGGGWRHRRREEVGPRG